jgi:HEAT repeat protein
LSDPRPQVRVAALAALEFRQHWRSHQPDVVLHLGKTSPEPEVRAAAVNALANLDDRPTIEALAEFLHDSSRLVRQTAAEALLWNTEDHWPWLRLAVRRALADPVCEHDGPLLQEGSVFTPEAIADLTAWCAEKGMLALRAAVTLGGHYNQMLSLGAGAPLLQELRRQLMDVRTPAMLRLELARVLHHHRELDPALLRHLLDPSNPTPLRLIAVEALLATGESPEAVAALHELARLPNREIALGIADIVQRRLGISLGLVPGEPQPPLHSRQAADVARRVLLWATEQEIPAEEPAGARQDEPIW